MTDQNLMPIGRFSACCRLSIKALRHYDKRGLLRPAHVDPGTGYRYYSRDQAREAVTIGMLRSLGLSLPHIESILRANPEKRTELLAQHRDRVARDLEKARQTLLTVTKLVEHDELLPYDIEIRVEPTYTVARKTCTTVADRMIEDSGDLIYELMDELAATGRVYESPVMCINGEPDPRERIVVHACVGVSAPYPDLPSADILEIPGGPVAWVTHHGAYEALGVAYHALFAWAQEHGHSQRDAVREIYLNDPATVTTDELETEVLLPIAP